MKRYKLTKRGEEVILALEAIGGAAMLFLVYVGMWLFLG